MKIFFINPEQYVNWENEPSNYELRLPILNCGVEIEYLDFPYGYCSNVKDIEILNERLIKICTEFKPDLIVYSTSRYPYIIKISTLQRLKKFFTLYVHIWDTTINSRVEEIQWFTNCTYLGLGDSLTNFIKYYSFLKYTSAKGMIFTAGHNVFTDIFKKLDVEKIYDVVIIGSYEGKRKEIINFLEKHLRKLGINFYKFGGLLNEKNFIPGKLGVSNEYLSYEDNVKIINQSKILISTQTQPNRKQIKGKIFEFLSCGAFCITDYNLDTQKIIPSNCIVYYESLNDLLDKIKYYFYNEKEREEIAKNGYEWYHKTFNYKKFWSEFIINAYQNKEYIAPEFILQFISDRITKKNFYVFNPLKKLYFVLFIKNLMFHLWSKRSFFKKLIGKKYYEYFKRQKNNLLRKFRFLINNRNQNEQI